MINKKVIESSVSLIVTQTKQNLKLRTKLYNDGTPDKPIGDKNAKGNACIGWGMRIHDGLVDRNNKACKMYFDSNGKPKNISLSTLESLLKKKLNLELEPIKKYLESKIKVELTDKQQVSLMMFIHSHTLSKFKTEGFSQTLLNAINRRDFGIACDIIKNHPTRRKTSKVDNKKLAKTFFNEILKATYPNKSVTKLDLEGKHFIQRAEGYEPNVYDDNNKTPKPTIGWGHNNENGAVIVDLELFSEVTDKAERKSILYRLFLNDLEIAESCVRRNIITILTQNEYNAMVSMAFNFGCGDFCGKIITPKHVNR